MFAQVKRTMVVRWVLATVAVVSLASAAFAINPPPPPRPTAPEELARAIERIEDVTAETTDRIEVLADRAVFRLERAALKGASSASLEKTARKAKKGFSSQARGGYAGVTREFGNAMIRMRSASGYTTDLQDDLEFEREESTAALQDAISAAGERIDEALAELAGSSQ